MKLDHPDLEKVVLKAARQADEEQRKLMNNPKEKILKEFNDRLITPEFASIPQKDLIQWISKALDEYVLAVIPEEEEDTTHDYPDAKCWTCVMNNGFNSAIKQTLKNAGIVE